MRVAVYHNLPPGGALRALTEFLHHSKAEHEYDLYTIDLGEFDGYASAKGRAEQRDLGAHVSKIFRYPIVSKRTARALDRRLWLATAPGWVGRVERRIASDINSRNYDVALVYSCQVVHSPSVLRHLNLPSLYYMNEPRRLSFEPPYRPPVDASVIQRIVKWGRERVLRWRDRTSVAAADCVVANSNYAAEYIKRAYGISASVCYLGIDTATFDVAADDESTNNPPSVISVGAVDPMKGHDLVVEALGLLPPESRPALDVVYERCDEAYRKGLQAQAAANGVDLRLHFGITDAELAAMYRKSSVTVLAAHLEPFG
ncbi:MAG TPA: glycosyltransferase, partial [Acidimicrobiales bacterium]